jgi:molecular chaperone Hsp33
MTDNFVQTFQLDQSNIRGRIVRVGSVLDDILNAHKYPDDVLHLTGEVLTLSVMLSSMLKYEGIFTLQTQSDGPVTMLVADMTSTGSVRACAAFREEEMLRGEWSQDRAELLGKGYMAFTVDQGENTDRYQGIVELKNTSLISSVQHYFQQSEQINTGMMMSVGKVNGKWRATGIMLQEMPKEGGHVHHDISNVDEDDWRRTMILLGSVKEEEMLSEDISAEDLLYRLFHEETVRVYEPLALKKVCRCNEDRVRTILSGMSTDDLEEMSVDGKITMTCEFCSRDYSFDPKDIQKDIAS